MHKMQDICSSVQHNISTACLSALVIKTRTTTKDMREEPSGAAAVTQLFGDEDNINAGHYHHHHYLSLSTSPIYLPFSVPACRRKIEPERFRIWVDPVQV